MNLKEELFKLKVLPAKLDGVYIIEPKTFYDNRGFFLETYHQRRYAGMGIDCNFVQDNLSRSVRGTLRGLHYQLRCGQAKLIQVIRGVVFDVVLDIRRGSPSFGKWHGVDLSDENKRQLFVPEGLAHGFCVLSETADVVYKCTDFYAPEDEGGILWSDPDVAIQWPVASPLISDKDSRLPRLADLPPERLPRYEEST
jgi:dTDP-4-dehydrorhamnose 3,5-epimerase